MKARRHELQVLPNFERAVVPFEKLYGYVLNPDHPKGRDKARVFKSALGIERRHAAVLAEIITASLPRALAKERRQDKHGRSWTTYHEIIGLSAVTAIVTVGWSFSIEEPDEPKLVSCYIELARQEELQLLLRVEQTGS